MALCGTTSDCPIRTERRLGSLYGRAWAWRARARATTGGSWTTRSVRGIIMLPFERLRRWARGYARRIATVSSPTNQLPVLLFFSLFFTTKKKCFFFYLGQFSSVLMWRRVLETLIDLERGGGGFPPPFSYTEQRERFMHHMDHFLAMSRQEQTLRLLGTLPSLEEFWSYRPGASAVHVTLAVNE